MVLTEQWRDFVDIMADEDNKMLWQSGYSAYKTLLQFHIALRKEGASWEDIEMLYLRGQMS